MSKVYWKPSDSIIDPSKAIQEFLTPEQKAQRQRSAENQAQFHRVLEKHMRYCVQAIPHRYAFVEAAVPEVTSRIMNSYLGKAFSFHDPSWYLAMFDLEIHPTKRDLAAFLKGQVKEESK